MRMFIPIAILALLTGIYGAIWWNRAGKVEETIAQWAEAQRAKGLEVAYERVGVSGFPLRMEATLEGVRLEKSAGPDGAGGWSWSSPLMRAHVLPYRFNHVIMAVDGTQTFAFPNAEGGPLTIEAEAERARASLVMEKGRPARFAFEAETLDALWRQDGAAPRRTTAENLQIHLRTAPMAPEAEAEARAATMAALDAAESVETAQASAPAGDRTDPDGPRTTLDLHVSGETLVWNQDGPAWAQRPANFEAVAHADRFPAAPWGSDPVGTWARGGGRLRIDKAALTWGDAAATVEGDLAVTPRAELDGRLQARLADHGALVATLTDAGLIDPSYRRPAETILDQLAVMSGDEEGGIAVPLDVRAGRIYLGPLRLAKLPPVY